MLAIFILALALLTAGFQTPDSDDLQPRQVIAVKPLIECSPVPTVTIELQPAIYNEFIPYTTVLYPFRDGNPFTVSKAPTSLRLSTTFTRTIIITYASTSSGYSTSAPLVTPTATLSKSSTSSPSPTITRTRDLSIGDGLPSGNVGQLPDSQFIFLAYTNLPTTTPAVVNKRSHIRRQDTSNSVSPLKLVDLSRPSGRAGGLDQDDCDDASPLLLRGGTLLQFDRAVAKAQGQATPLLGFLNQPSLNEVNTTFSLADGFLLWETLDNGLAAFFDCDGLIYVGFGEQIPGCIQVLVGAIAGRACIDRVQQTMPPNPTFTPPIPIVFSTTETKSTSSKSLYTAISSSLFSTDSESTLETSSTISVRLTNSLSTSSTLSTMPIFGSTSTTSSSSIILSLPTFVSTLTTFALSSSSSTTITTSISLSSLTTTSTSTTSTSSPINSSSSVSQSPSFSSSILLSSSVTSSSTTSTSSPLSSSSSVSQSPSFSSSILLSSSVTSSSTTSSAASCATGIAYAIQPNPFVRSASPYPNFDPSVFYNASSVQQGDVDIFFLDANPVGALQGEPSLDFTLKIINHRGYLVAKAPGTYNFTIPDRPDDIMLLWIGQFAYSGYTRANANAVVELAQTGQTVSVLVATATPAAPAYVPFRLIVGNSSGALRYSLTIRGPGNVVLVDGTTNGQDNLVQSCPARGASAFPDFGSEP